QGPMPGITPAQKGIILKGNNFSDDLFLFIKVHHTGLKPNTEYSVKFTIDVVTNTPPDAIGGGSLYLKAGATVAEPVKVEQNGMYRMNIQKGQQANPGPDM